MSVTYWVTDKKGRIIYAGPDRRLAVYWAGKYLHTTLKKVTSTKTTILWKD